MSKQLTLSSVLAIFAMLSLVVMSSAHQNGTEAGHGIADLQAELPQVDEDALGLLSPGWFSN